jgi:hypothetical protein
MRRTVVLMTLLALAAPFAATAAMRAPGDGTVSIQKLDGLTVIKARGAIIGRCDQCSLLLDERYPAADTISPIVSGAKGRDIDADDTKERFVGTNVRWKVIGGNFRAVVRGTNVHISVVGKGSVRIQGTAGTYVVNDSEIQTIKSDPTIFWLNSGTTP